MTALDPLALECVGQYGYGTGYFAAIGAHHIGAMKAGGVTLLVEAVVRAHCEMCVARPDCFSSMKARVTELRPEVAARLEAKRNELISAGVPTCQADAATRCLEADGHRDPFLDECMVNLQRGVDGWHSR